MEAHEVSACIRSDLPRPRRIMSPFLYYGGKGIIAKRILRLLPEGHIYVEPYCGAASLLFHKYPSPIEVLNDIDGDIVNLFRVLQDEKTFSAFAHRITWTLYSRAEFQRAIEYSGDDPVERAWAYFVKVNQSMNGLPCPTVGSWGRAFVASCRMSMNTAKWRARIALLQWWHDRLSRVQIDCRDALEVIAYWDSPDTVFYLDPPYVGDSRHDPDVYRYEADIDHHRKLVDVLLGIKGQAMLSGYDNDVYNPLVQAGWHVVRFDTVCYAVPRTRSTVYRGTRSLHEHATRTEIVWIKRKERALS